MSPTARYADYLFPSTVALEAGDWTKIGGEVLYRPPVSKAPNETKDGWTYAYEAYKAHSKLGSFNGVNTKNAHLKYVGTINTTKKYQTAEVMSFKVVDDALKDKSSRFYGMSRAEFFTNQYRPRKNAPLLITKPDDLYHSSTLKTNFGGLMREALDKHMSNSKNFMTKPFIKDIGNSSISRHVLMQMCILSLDKGLIISQINKVIDQTFLEDFMCIMGLWFGIMKTVTLNGMVICLKKKEDKAM